MTEYTVKNHNWKKDLVLIAKNTFVWMHQLSEAYNKEIKLLDQIPVEEIKKFADFGITGIWLIGIWERSPASRKIKNLYGFDHAAASAYSIRNYEISPAIGGRKSLLRFRETANQFGIKIGCDMVPNHTGLDYPWLIEHPDWFIQAEGNPSRDFTFNSPDLSPVDGIEIKIEEGYYTRTGAAEVFLYRNKETGEEKYIYHGNDGTSMPWNDTAQLNYLIPQVRQEVRKTILEVASDFDIIRLDAAMTLTRKHFKRLWFPGDDGERCIPTREKDYMSNAAFDRLMPEEFWKHVVDDISEKQPDTLLIAEAFWLMEGYFIKHLGMDRVYNSAFMNMMKCQENQKFKNCLRDMSLISPRALEHLVNYQTTPDEESAINQFGNGEKYFGVATLLCTLPGLPMIGHGQLSGYRERYGMDYLVPHMQEAPDQDLYRKHQRLLSPLLQRRGLFSSCENFRIIEFVGSDGNVVNDLLAFVNENNGIRTLVAYNNSHLTLQGKIDLSTFQSESSPIALTPFEREAASQIEIIYSQLNNEITLKLPPYAAEVFLISEN